MAMEGDRFEAIRQFIARVARNYGLSADDAEDCAMELVLRLAREDSGAAVAAEDSSTDFVAPRSLLRPELPPRERCAWFRRCVVNHVKNFRIRLIAQKRHEGVSLSALASEGLAAEGDCLTAGDLGAVRTRPWESPEAITVAKLSAAELWSVVAAVLAQQPARSRENFIRFHLQDESAAEIGADTGQSAAAVRQTIYRNRIAMEKAHRRRGHEPPE